MSYSEILQHIHVAKSTLSNWLHTVQLAKRHATRLSTKKRLSALRGAAAKKKIRVDSETLIKKCAALEIGNVSNRDLLMIGVAIYWAEGSKIKSYQPSVGMKFSNSDPGMIKIFICWCKTILQLSPEDLSFSIYIHISDLHRGEAIIKYWASVTGIDSERFGKIYFKRHNLSPKRKHVGQSYMGQMCVSIKKSVNINRKISGYIEEIVRQCGIV